MTEFEWYDAQEQEIAAAFSAFSTSPGGCFVVFPLIDVDPPAPLPATAAGFPVIFCEYAVDTQSAEASFLDSSFDPDDGLIVVRAVFRVQPGPGARAKLRAARVALVNAFRSTYGDAMGIPLPYTAGAADEFAVAGLNLPLELRI